MFQQPKEGAGGDHRDETSPETLHGRKSREGKKGDECVKTTCSGPKRVAGEVDAQVQDHPDDGGCDGGERRAEPWLLAEPFNMGSAGEDEQKTR